MVNPHEGKVVKTIRIEGGAHSPEEFASGFLLPLFSSGVISVYPGADFYAICYGELCAYRNMGSHPDELLAVWTAGVPDVECDVVPGADYAGKWKPQRTKKKKKQPGAVTLELEGDELRVLEQMLRSDSVGHMGAVRPRDSEIKDRVIEKVRARWVEEGGIVDGE